MQITLPTREELRPAFDQAVAEINGFRNSQNLTGDFYRKIGDFVFDTAYYALFASLAWAHGVHDEIIGRVQVISAPVGSGKTTFATAFMAAWTRFSEALDNVPHGCVFVADQIVKADEMYTELSRLLPGKVAIWTTDHDPSRKTPTRLTAQPAVDRRYTKESLKNYPVIVVTHAFYQGVTGHFARTVLHKGKSEDRALTVVDEKPEEVAIHDVVLSQIQRAREFVQQDADRKETVGPHMDVLFSQTAKWETAKGKGVEIPSPEVEQNLMWFGTNDANAYAKNNSNTPDIASVFSFARDLARGYAFVARNQEGNVTRFVGYEPKIVASPGMILLDATADIDGMSAISTHRIYDKEGPPHARYDKLEVVYLAQHTKGTLKKYLKTAANQQHYVHHVLSVIKDHMRAGQKGLIVVKKDVVDAQLIPAWPRWDARFTKVDYKDDFGWELDGRSLSVTYWGTGIGSNKWKDADVVFLFDEHYMPKRTAIGIAQGIGEHKAHEGPLRNLTTTNTKEPTVDIVYDGHLLRYHKQMALRGKARIYDGAGVCGSQKLVATGNLKRLLAYAGILFPKAMVTCGTGQSSKWTQAEALLGFLSKPNLPNTVPTSMIGAALGAPWREISKNVMKVPSIAAAYQALGWAYTGKAGCKGKAFVKTAASSERLAA